MTLIKDLIDIPERLHKGDFVLNLSSGVVQAKQTLDTYVVTPQLLECFKDALGFIRSAMDVRTSKAAYLHGSFGSGKSHFMAVLHLILQNNSEARVKPELSPLFDSAPWIGPQSFLLVPYHMIGATSMESAILGGYASYVRKLHPSAPEPGVYLSQSLFDNAVSQRRQLGDAKFFDILNQGKGDSGWGALDEGWSAASFQKAISAPNDDADRIRLVGDLVTTHFPVVAQMARVDSSQLVDFDQGLSVISGHARDLGYDGLILFLDELILWLASHAADLEFVHREGSKLAKLVESGAFERPAPIVSFVARQRDLRELVGEGHTGLQSLNFSDALKHWEGRFHKITLEDRNLPEIAHKRVLRPKNDAARQEIDDAFKRFLLLKDNVMTVLLTGRADPTIFRKVYPFSPVLIDTLIAVSSALQRERTALKIMVELLVEQRETLELGQLIPVGDLFDVISRGDEAFSAIMKDQFNHARRLLHQKLIPLLERVHDVSADPDPGQLAADPDMQRKLERLRNDARLLKTLLLAALVPEVESLRGLTAQRLATLNHGIIKVPVPGGESRAVLSKLRNWSADVGEIKLQGDEANPFLAIQLTGVDVDAIIGHAMAEDNPGNRRRKLRETLFGMLGIPNTDDPVTTKELIWKSTRRTFQVSLSRMRELSPENCQADGDGWRLLIDFPFDEGGHSPHDGVARFDHYRRSGLPSTLTIGWFPSFLSTTMQKDLGRLVVIDYILTGERDKQHLGHLPPQDREPARHVLESMASALRAKLKKALMQAYGLGGEERDVLEPAHELELAEHFDTLASGFSPRPPVAEDLSDAMGRLVAQALEFQFPGHPDFKLSREITKSDVGKVWGQVQSALGVPDHRYPADRSLRDLLSGVAVPLKLIELGETHFVLDRHWMTTFDRRLAEQPSPNLSVRKLSQWMEEPLPMGLPPGLKHLVVLMYARRTHRTFYKMTTALDPDLDKITDDLELRLQTLPDEALWATAVERATQLLATPVARVRNAANVEALVSQLQAWARERYEAVDALVGQLATLVQKVGMDAATVPRLSTARQAKELLAGLSGENTLKHFVQHTESGNPVCLKASIETARSIGVFLDSDHMRVLQQLPGLPKVQPALQALQAVLAKEEFGSALLPMLQSAHHEVISALLDSPQPPPPPPPPRRTEPVRPGGGSVSVRDTVTVVAVDEQGVADAITTLQALQTQHGDRVRVNISWRLS